VLAVNSGVTQSLDEAVLSYLTRHRSIAGDWFFRIITWTGSLSVLIPTGSVVAYFLIARHRKKEAVFLISGFAAAVISCQVLKLIIDRGRPEVAPALAETFSNHSFPSGHATQIVAMSAALYFVMKRVGYPAQAMAAVGMLLLSLSVMVSRLYLQVHYPTDVIGGAVLALICVLGGAAICFPDKNASHG
jgi:undecaprenyl-diphosphatase